MQKEERDRKLRLEKIKEGLEHSIKSSINLIFIQETMDMDCACMNKSIFRYRCGESGMDGPEMVTLS